MTEGEKVTVAVVVREVSAELATHIDLCYDDDDFPHLPETFKRIEAAANLLVSLDQSIPPAVDNILKRYRRSLT